MGLPNKAETTTVLEKISYKNEFCWSERPVVLLLNARNLTSVILCFLLSLF